MRWDNLFDDLESQLEDGLGAEEGELRAEEERLRLARLTVRDRLLLLRAAGGADGGARVAAAGDSVRVMFAGERPVDLRPSLIGRDWCAAELLGPGGQSGPCLVALTAVTGLVLSRGQVRSSLGGEAAPAPRGSSPVDRTSGADAPGNRLEEAGLPFAAAVRGAPQHPATPGPTGPERPPVAGTLAERLGLGYVLRDLCRRRLAVEVWLLGGVRLHGTIDRVGRDHLDLAVHERGVARRESAVSQYRVIPLTALELVRY